MTVAVIDKDRGWKAFLEPFRTASPRAITMDVGTDVFYSLFLEYGTSRMAARPYLRWTLDEHDNYRAEIKRLAAHLLRMPNLGPGDPGMTAAANLKLLGEQIAKDLQRTIIGMGLIDTGRLLHSQRVLRVDAGDRPAANEATAQASWGAA